MGEPPPNKKIISPLYGDREEINYAVKIHGKNCGCKYYKNKVYHRDMILVAPYKKNDYGNHYFIYETETDLQNDIDLFKDNCLCTYSDNILNGGIIIINETMEQFTEFNDTTEMVELQYRKLSDIYTICDKSNLINLFCEEMKGQDFFVLIGKNNSIDSALRDVHYSFPKGKIKYGENVDDCAVREFEEETGVEIPEEYLSNAYQKEKRMIFDLSHRFQMPYEIRLNNFLLRIIIV
jgi:hypothetical protein